MLPGQIGGEGQHGAPKPQQKTNDPPTFGGNVNQVESSFAQRLGDAQCVQNRQMNLSEAVGLRGEIG
jgi:hypothetical protein